MVTKKKKLSLSNEEEIAMTLYNSICYNKRLNNLEKNGFLHGARRKKIMDVDQKEIYRSLEKQWNDFRNAYLCCQSNHVGMRCLADLRNVAGCLFLKLEKEA